MRDRLIYLGAFALGFVLFQQCDAKRQREIGALNALNGQLAASHRVLAQRADSLERSFRTETVTVRQTVTRFRTIVDSIVRFDTIPVTKRETLIVERAAAAIGACTDALGTCAALVRSKDALLANRDSALRTALSLRPSFWERRRDDAVKIGLGVALHWAVAR